jgi:quercetin dioxygenase-like cupin family protein
LSQKIHIRQIEPFRWEDVPVLAYKEEDGTSFKNITRQVLFNDDDRQGVQLRYFEIAPGGHSTLERHDHIHSVMVIRGRGRALVGTDIHTLGPHDLVSVPPLTWHQFQPNPDEFLGFLCLVKNERDKPQRPTAADLATLRTDSKVASFIRV